MNGDQGFLFLPGAVQELNEIYEYIAADNPAAERVCKEILDAIRSLVKFPHQGHRRPDLASGPLRFQLVREYLIAHAPDEKRLVVIAVIHGRRNPRIIAAALRGR